VGHVYALNRSSGGQNLADRQLESFADRALDVALLKSPKLTLIEADTKLPDLGLDPGLLADIRATLTTIVHNAWRLDFNLSVLSFESHIASTRNLVDLALSVQGPRPANVLFTSSISTLTSWHEPHPVPEEELNDPSIAVGTGYGESKWVAEQVLARASKEVGLNVSIWRIGQLAGSKINGAWNTTDWVPILIKSSRAIGALPHTLGDVSWVPIDSAANSILDSVQAGQAISDYGVRYVHLVHPKSTKWNEIFRAVSSSLSLPLIPYSEWVARLQDASLKAGGDASVADHIPAIKLIDFFRTAFPSTPSGSVSEGYRPKEALGADLATEKTIGVSGTLRDLEQLNEKDVRRWLQYWESHSFLA